MCQTFYSICKNSSLQKKSPGVQARRSLTSHLRVSDTPTGVRLLPAPSAAASLHPGLAAPEGARRSSSPQAPRPSPPSVPACVWPTAASTASRAACGSGLGAHSVPCARPAAAHCSSGLAGACSILPVHSSHGVVPSCVRGTAYYDSLWCRRAVQSRQA